MVGRDIYAVEDKIISDPFENLNIRHMKKINLILFTFKQKARKTGKRKKKENLTIHEKEEIKLNDPPKGWKLIGYKTSVIQDIIVRANNIEYKLEKWQSPDGKQIQVAEMADHLKNSCLSH